VRQIRTTIVLIDAELDGSEFALRNDKEDYYP
jgi:hypothetical protein